MFQPTSLASLGARLNTALGQSNRDRFIVRMVLLIGTAITEEEAKYPIR